MSNFSLNVLMKKGSFMQVSTVAAQKCNSINRIKQLMLICKSKVSNLGKICFTIYIKNDTVLLKKTFPVCGITQ